MLIEKILPLKLVVNRRMDRKRERRNILKMVSGRIFQFSKRRKLIQISIKVPF
jgi:hypothetical protein